MAVCVCAGGGGVPVGLGVSVLVLCALEGSESLKGLRVRPSYFSSRYSFSHTEVLRVTKLQLQKPTFYVKKLDSRGRRDSSLPLLWQYVPHPGHLLAASRVHAPEDVEARAL